ncbi:MAG: Holliday junction resolvase RuvX [Bacteroidota bacterium]|nr:Holliday junction resolvase RuvX [Bacteroidota bacterium]
MRIVAIDYGRKRTGLAASDITQMIASPVETIETLKLIPFLKSYFLKEPVEKVIIGLPTDLRGNTTHSTEDVKKFIQLFQKEFPNIPIISKDERFTSKMAMDTMIAGGTSKKYRKDKTNLDKLSAVILLQEYLDYN